VRAFLAVCRAATPHAVGSESPVLSPGKPNGSFAIFFSKVRIPSKAVERKHEDSKATYGLMAFNRKVY